VAWDVIFYETAQGSAPGADFLDGCPAKVRGTILAVLDAVAAAPPPAFSGGGKWEAMHGDMGGYYEIRVTGPGREQFRLFCLLENADVRTLTARGLRGPAIAVIAGMRKRSGTVFSKRDYVKVRRLGSDHTTQTPRRIAK
jgi:Txe/YoeB family toxin of Txe-Axe toxin-antitoxin module